MNIIENSGSVEVCVAADHESQTSFEVLLTTRDSSAIGKFIASSVLWSIHLHCVIMMGSLV